MYSTRNHNKKLPKPKFEKKAVVFPYKLGIVFDNLYQLFALFFDFPKGAAELSKTNDNDASFFPPRLWLP